MSGASGTAYANLCDGRSPRRRDVCGDAVAHQRVILDPALVIDELKVFTAGKKNATTGGKLRVSGTPWWSQRDQAIGS